MGSNDININIDIFENCVIKHNENHPHYYILSNGYRSIDHNGTALTKISIFDKERGTIKEDRKKINEILKILMSNIDPKNKKELLKQYNLQDKEKRAIGSMLGTKRYGRI